MKNIKQIQEEIRKLRQINDSMYPTSCAIRIIDDLEQIQEYNRKKIICAVNNANCFKNCFGQKDKLRLDRILLALNYDRSLQNITRSCYGILLESIILYTEDQDIDIICNWDLTKPTLEEQTEETQRAIYKLLGGE